MFEEYNRGLRYISTSSKDFYCKNLVSCVRNVDPCESKFANLVLDHALMTKEFTQYRVLLLASVHSIATGLTEKLMDMYKVGLRVRVSAGETWSSKPQCTVLECACMRALHTLMLCCKGGRELKTETHACSSHRIC